MNKELNIRALISLLGIVILVFATGVFLANTVFAERLADEPLLRVFQSQEYEPFANHLQIDWKKDEQPRSFGYIRIDQPVVVVNASSAPHYVFLAVESYNGSIKKSELNTPSIHTQLVKNGWKRVRINGNLSGKRTSYYAMLVDGSFKARYLPTYKTLSVVSHENVMMRTTAPIGVEAYSIQQNGFDTAFDAWEAVFD